MGDRSRGFDVSSGFGDSGAGFGTGAYAAGAGVDHDLAVGSADPGSVAIGIEAGASAARTAVAGAGGWCGGCCRHVDELWQLFG